MNGFQVTFYSHQGRRHAHEEIQDWLLKILAAQGIKGATVTVGAESFGRSGRMHSKDFVELADQPIEVTVAMTQAQADALFAVLEAEKVDLFYIKMPIEYGFLGAPSGDTASRRDASSGDPA